MTTHDYEYGNRTVYGIKSDAVRYTWAGYHIFVIASSIIGDTTILLACMKYKAFKLHRVLIVVVQHMSICNLMLCVTDILPRLVSIIAEDWILGQFLCKFCFYTIYYINQTSTLLISVMTTSKLLLLRYPLRFGATTLKKANMFCLTCWFVAFVLPAAGLLVDWQDIYFKYQSYQCDHSFSSDTWLWLIPLLTILTFIPTGQVVVTTISLLITAKQCARRNRDSLKWQGIMATVLTATVYCISVLPYSVYSLGRFIVNMNDKSKSLFYTSFYRITISCLTLNTISNFYVLSLTVLSFREFVLSRIELTYGFFTTNLGFGGRRPT